MTFKSYESTHMLSSNIRSDMDILNSQTSPRSSMPISSGLRKSNDFQEEFKSQQSLPGYFAPGFIPTKSASQ